MEYPYIYLNSISASFPTQKITMPLYLIRPTPELNEVGGVSIAWLLHAPIVENTACTIELDILIIFVRFFGSQFCNVQLQCVPVVLWFV